MSTWSPDEVVAHRLRAQRLTSAPVSTAAAAVSILTCVQAQEREHAFFSLGLRTGATRAHVQAELDRGEVLRTHALRPTWHFVLPGDLRWILALTSPRVEAKMVGQSRELGLDDPRTVDRALALLRDLLAGRRYLTRAEIGSKFSASGRDLPSPGLPVGHLLMMAELRGIICSGPLKGVHHSYALVDEVVAPTEELDREEALRRLVHRFFAGHGPASIADFTRWSSLTASDAHRALLELDDRLERARVDGLDLWFDPTAVPPAAEIEGHAWLLPVYDEAVLTYPRLSFAVSPDHPHNGPPDPFWAPVVHERTNVGLWKRAVGRGRVTVEVRLAASLSSAARDGVRAAASRLGDFLGLPLEYVEGSGTPPLWRGRRPRA